MTMYRPTCVLLASALLAAACGSDSSDDNAASNSTASTAAEDTTGTNNSTVTIAPSSPTSSTDTSTEDTILDKDGDGEPDFVPLPPSSSASVVSQRYNMLGGWDGTKWVSYGQPESFDAPAEIGDEFTIVRLNGNNSKTTVSSIGDICDPIGSVGIITNPEIPAEWGGDDPIAVKASWDLQPHGLPASGTPVQLYYDAVREFFSDRGVEVGDIDITQWFKLDLEGDGVDEVVLSAKTAGLDPSQGTVTYPAVSIVLMRRVIDEKVTTWFLSNNIYTEADGESLGDETAFIQTFRITSFADLNGDGKLEIVINDQGFEGAGTTVWEYVNDIVGPKAVLDGGCGV